MNPESLEEKPLSVADALLVLGALPRIGPITIRKLMDAFGGDVLQILRASERELMSVPDVGGVMAAAIRNWREHVDIAGLRHKMETHQVEFVPHGDERYPSLLHELYDAPLGLYHGGPVHAGEKCIAIVGTRHATLYGMGVAKRLAREFATMGFCVVSGMARGIDSAAHEGALEAGGETVAVMGCGLDIIYPPENADLFRRLRERGGVYSEFPLGRRADKQTFPMRNRLIAGMSRAVVVVESSEQGGSLITARFAGEQGRQVFAVPGRIDQDASRGCHQLIRDGATLITSAAEVAEDLDYLFRAPGSEKLFEAMPEPDGLSDDEQRVFAVFRDGAQYASDAVVEMTGLPQPKVAAALMMLELKRVIAKYADGRFEVRR